MDSVKARGVFRRERLAYQAKVTCEAFLHDPEAVGRSLEHEARGAIEREASALGLRPLHDSWERLPIRTEMSDGTIVEMMLEPESYHPESILDRRARRQREERDALLSMARSLREGIGTRPRAEARTPVYYLLGFIMAATEVPKLDPVVATFIEAAR